MTAGSPHAAEGNADDRGLVSGTGTPAARPESEEQRVREDEEQGEREEEEQRVRRPGELWRIEGSVSAVRAEISQLTSLDDEELRTRIAELERRWRAELIAVLPESVVPELHDYFDWLGEVPPRVSELRIGLAQLSGWLDGIIVGLGVSIGPGGSGDGDLPGDGGYP